MSTAEDAESVEQRGCYGCDAINLTTGTYQRFVSKSTVVATGGCGQIYPETTNPHVATGDGIAMAARAGAKVENMEFIQFHPTSLFVETSENEGGETNQVFLISEAVRGAGAVLRNAKGETFMDLYDPRGEASNSCSLTNFSRDRARPAYHRRGPLTFHLSSLPSLETRNSTSRPGSEGHRRQRHLRPNEKARYGARLP